MQLKQVPYNVSSMPNSICLLVVQAMEKDLMVIVYHQNIFGSMVELLLNLNPLTIKNRLLMMSSISWTAVYFVFLSYNVFCLCFFVCMGLADNGQGRLPLTPQWDPYLIWACSPSRTDCSWHHWLAELWCMSSVRILRCMHADSMQWMSLRRWLNSCWRNKGHRVLCDMQDLEVMWVHTTYISSVLFCYSCEHFSTSHHSWHILICSTHLLVFWPLFSTSHMLCINVLIQFVPRVFLVTT